MSLKDLLNVPLSGNSSLSSLLNVPLPDQEIKLKTGQIWINDHDNIKCKIISFDEKSVQILLNINFHKTSGKTGAKKYNDLWLDYFLDNWSIYEN